CNLLDTEREHVNDELSATGNHSTEAHEAARCLAIARTKMQEACMWACRAVARPDADC
ncbi:Acb2/Tad1 domain-containing protein, partial [Enterobacter hormaechei]